MKYIKNKIIAAVIFCSLLSTVICGGISIVNSSKTSVEDSKRQMEIACITQTDKLDSVLSMFKHWYLIYILLMEVDIEWVKYTLY